MQRLEQGRKAFINNFLIPEVKKLCKSLGFKNFPTPHFEEIDIREASIWNRVVAQLMQLGVLTAEEGVQAIETGRLPDSEESVESQRKFKELKDEGLYAPLTPTPNAGLNTGRPPGSSSPQSSKNVSPKGENKKAPAIASFSVGKVSASFKDFETLTAQVEEFLKKKHKKKSLNEEQKNICEEIAKNIFINEDKSSWASSIKNYINPEYKPQNKEKLKELKTIMDEHSIELFHAAILNHSQKL